MLNAEIRAYHRAQTGVWRSLCDLLGKEISAALPQAESKVWHGSPVWFVDGNPLVGYHKLKDCVRILFWSGQTFKEPGLAREGSFKAAEARFTALDQVNRKDLKRWLKKAYAIQWDYKNIMKRRGVLVRIDPKAAAKKKAQAAKLLPEELSNPAKRAFKAAKIETLKKLATLSEKEILQLHGVGPSTLPVLRAALRAQGLKFKK